MEKLEAKVEWHFLPGHDVFLTENVTKNYKTLILKNTLLPNR